MSDKRNRQTKVLCTDDVWSRFQALAAARGATLPVLLGEIVEDATATALNEQATLRDVFEEESNGHPGTLARPLIGFGQPVIRIR